MTISKAEIEKYKIEMSKSEENMRKALMRGVCALNMEAMSIFNETIATNVNNTNKLNETQFQKTLITDEQCVRTNKNQMTMPTPELNLHIEPVLETRYSHQSIESSQFDNRQHSNHLSNQLSSKESCDLAKKVKSFCETNLNKISQLNNSVNKNLSAVTKAKLQLLQSSQNGHLSNHQQESNIANNSYQFSHNQNSVKHQEHLPANAHLHPKHNISLNNNNNNNNRVYEELVEHKLPPVILLFNILP